MPIVGGLDIHRKQITFDYPGTATGEVQRGQVAPRPRAPGRVAGAAVPRRPGRGLRAGGMHRVAVCRRGVAAAGLTAHVGEPADTAAARGRKKHAKTDRTDSRHLRQLLADGRLPECWIPPSHILECRALLELYHDLRTGHTAWVQRIHAVLFHQGARQLGDGHLRTAGDLAQLRAIAAAQLSPAGQLQVATALDMLTALEDHLDAVRRRLLEAARQLTGAKVLQQRLYGWGRSPRWRCAAGWAARAGSPPRARQSGSPGSTSPSTPRPASAARAPVPAGTGGAALVRL